jgi:hypothetical protein
VWEEERATVFPKYVSGNIRPRSQTHIEKTRIPSNTPVRTSQNRTDAFSLEIIPSENFYLYWRIQPIWSGGGGGLRRGSAAVRLLGMQVRIPPGACLSVMNVVCCQVEVSASGWSLVQRSPTECGVSECDREPSIMRRLWPSRGCCAAGEGNCWNPSCPMSSSFALLSPVLITSCDAYQFLSFAGRALWCAQWSCTILTITWISSRGKEQHACSCTAHCASLRPNYIYHTIQGKGGGRKQLARNWFLFVCC